MTDPEKLARAVLLFHQGGNWGEEQRRLWRLFTAEDGATTKVLCDLARRVLKPMEGDNANTAVSGEVESARIPQDRLL